MRVSREDKDFGLTGSSQQIHPRPSRSSSFHIQRGKVNTITNKQDTQPAVFPTTVDTMMEPCLPSNGGMVTNHPVEQETQRSSFRETLLCGSLSITLASIDASNISQLASINSTVLPVTYLDRFYADIYQTHPVEFSCLGIYSSFASQKFC